MFITTSCGESEKNKAEEFLRRYVQKKINKKERKHKVATIYVIGVGEYVKIGFTASSIDSRLRCMKVSMPEDPVVYATFPGSRADELHLHKRFSDLRTKREWFLLGAELEEWISEGCPYRSISSRDTDAEACSSAVERGPYTADAAGSNPAAPT